MKHSKMLVFLKSHLHLLIGMSFHNYTLVPNLKFSAILSLSFLLSCLCCGMSESIIKLLSPTN